MNEWLDISTAPKDGTRILLSNYDWVEIGRWRADWPPHDQQWHPDSNAGWVEHDWATHWQPLPPPPSDEIGSPIDECPDLPTDGEARA